nr:restriction endonuclease subunit S [uncultured Ligilactobacillus sp.]
MAKTNQEEQRKAPILRFKGFTNDWEQRELGNLFTERNERSLNGELLSVTLANGVVKFNDLNKKDNSNIKSGKYKVVKKNDIPYNSMRMWQGASGVSLYEGIVSPAYTVLIPTKQVDSKFYSILFKKQSILILFSRFSQGLTSDTWNLKYPILKKIKVPFTKLNEQKIISDIFNKIDNLLVLYERKSNLLSQMKKYFLDNLFTENKYPNLRFKSYKDPWINKKISDFLSKPLKEKVSVNETSKILTVQLNLRGVTSGAVRSSLKLGATNYYKRKAGQLIYGKQNLFNGALAIIPEKYNNFVTSGDVPSLDINNISSDFIYYLFSRDNFYKKTEIYATGTGSKRIHEDVLLKIKIYVPQNINEQKQISNIIKTFIKIDSKYEKKLHLLRKIKQKLLDTMFI